jgi:GTP1/Obg family GTP-binding protein
MTSEQLNDNILYEDTSSDEDLSDNEFNVDKCLQNITSSNITMTQLHYLIKKLQDFKESKQNIILDNDSLSVQLAQDLELAKELSNNIDDKSLLAIQLAQDSELAKELSNNMEPIQQPRRYSKLTTALLSQKF